MAAHATGNLRVVAVCHDVPSCVANRSWVAENERPPVGEGGVTFRLGPASEELVGWALRILLSFLFTSAPSTLVSHGPEARPRQILQRVSKSVHPTQKQLISHPHLKLNFVVFISFT